MNNSLTISHLRKNLFSYILSFLAILCIYFIPAFSHHTGIPIYLFEPMRIFIILALLHSNKANAYLLAVTLPLFSFALTSHPVLLKSIIISAELVMNVFFYHLLIQKKVAPFMAVLASVIASKLIYYLLKFLLIHFVLIESGLVSTPIYIQIVTTLSLVMYSFLVILIPKMRKNS